MAVTRAARFGYARFGASYFGDASSFVTITIGGTRRESLILTQTLTIVDDLNEKPDTATFICRSGFTPETGQPVIITVGGKREFHGHITQLRLILRNRTRKARWEVTCIDRKWMLDQILVTYHYAEQTGKAMIEAILARYAPDFSDTSCIDEIGTMEESQFANERVSAALTKICTRLNAMWLLDGYDRVHVLPITGITTTPRRLTDPVSLTSTNLRYWDFNYSKNRTQLRTRQIVEGKATTIPVEIPAGTDTDTQWGLPIPYEAYYFNRGGGYVRIGSTLCSYFRALYAAGPQAAEVTFPGGGPGDVALNVTTNLDLLQFGAPYSTLGYGWLTDGKGNYCYMHVHPSITTLLDDIPASGFGSMKVVWPAGTALYAAHILEAVEPLTASGVFEVTQPQGTSATVRESADDSIAALDAAGKEGGDGIREEALSGELIYANAASLAASQLQAFAYDLEEADWSTRDRNARAGTIQGIAQTGTITITTSLVITRVTMSGFARRGVRWPVRHVEASSVKPIEITDLLASIANRVFWL